MSAMMRLPWLRPLPSNGALNILQSWAPGGRTRESISMKFGMQQQVRTAMTVTWSNIKIFKIQNGGRPPCLKIVTSHHVPDMSPTIRLPWQRPLHSNDANSNDALNILQLWTSGGRTCEPSLITFGTQQQIRTAMTVTWLNIKIFKIQNGGRPPCWKIFEMP